MAIQNIQLFQSAQDPSSRWIQVQVNNGGGSAPIYSFTLDESQFAQFANSGLTSSKVFNQGPFSGYGGNTTAYTPGALDYFVKNESPTSGAVNGSGIKELVGKVGQAETKSDQDLANNKAEQQRLVDGSYGGKNNAISNNAKALDAAKQKILGGGLTYGGTTNPNSDAIKSLAESMGWTGPNLQTGMTNITNYLKTGQWPSTKDVQGVVHDGSEIAKILDEKILKTDPNSLALTEAQKAQYTNQPTTQGGGIKYQILNLDAMKQYDPSQYSRQADGSVILNTGVAPKSGTVKEIGGSTQPTVPGATTPAAPVAADANGLKIGPQELKNLQASGATGADFTVVNGDYFVKPTSKFYNQSQGDLGVPITNTVTTNPTATPGAGNPLAANPLVVSDGLKAANAIIDGSDLPPELKELYKKITAEYPGQSFNVQELLNTFQKMKTDTIDPYYKNLLSATEHDLKTNLDTLTRDREAERETLATNAGQDIRQAKTNLEKSGMTFSGKAIETLGADAAYGQNQGLNGGVIPTQTPFGGSFYEGTANQKNRLMSTSASARYSDALQALGRRAEESLGTTEAGGLGIAYNPAGSRTGSIEDQKQKQYGDTMRTLFSNYQQRDKLTQNQNPIK